MATLLFRDLIDVAPAPIRDYEFKDIRIKNNLFRIYTDGAVWDISYSRWREPDIDKDGYRIHHLGSKTVKLHRLILMVYSRPPRQSEQGRHLDGDPSNNDKSNLEWGTGKQNWIDRRLHGRESAEWRRLLTNEQALAIYNDPRPENDIAKAYDISRNSIMAIKEKLTYKDIHNETL
jgi:hypothetical protein